jgi:pyridinium-3,5-biscarboxylic acid mononucleotide synthase
MSTMDEAQLKLLLAAVASGATSIDEAVQRLRRLPFEQLPFATIDHHRALRCGHPEVIFCQGKTIEQVVQIAQSLRSCGSRVLATRASLEQIWALRQQFDPIFVSELGRAALIGEEHTESAAGAGAYVALLCAGTADLPVAEEAAVTLRSMRVPTRRLTDVGVSGLHRLLAQADVLQGACTVIVVAGMEGALPSVVGGLVACPVIAVPTSVGYGASMNGLAALLGMLNSCAPSVTTVNIDNGFGAAFVASLVHRQVSSARSADPQ